MSVETKGAWDVVRGLWESAWPFLFAIDLALVFPLLAPQEWLEGLGLAQLLPPIRGYLGAGFVVISCFLVARFVQWLVSAFSKKMAIRSYQKLLHSLSPEEKAILKKFVDGDTKTVALDIRSGVACGLVAQRIISMASSIGRFGTYFDHNIQPWALAYLKGHPKLV